MYTRNGATQTARTWNSHGAWVLIADVSKLTVGSSFIGRLIHLPMKMEPLVSSETSAIRTQTPGNYPKRNKLKCFWSLRAPVFCSTYCRAVCKMGNLVQQDKQCMYKPNSEGRSRNPLCCRRAICITYSDCVSVALFIQHASRVCFVTLSAVACLTVP